MIKRTLLICLCLGFGYSLPTLAETDEGIDAKSFVHEKCSSCHDSSIYTRKNRRVDSLSRLNSQVRMCDAQLGTNLFDEDVTAIVNYLNDNYYHFDK
jgi:hypothetical protein